MRQVTMREVAQKAQVSIRTVSRVINAQGEITETTRQRVLAAIEALGYRPSKVARALVTRRSDTIGLIVSDIANPFFSEVARAVQSKANVEGYDVFFCNSSGSWEEELRAKPSMARSSFRQSQQCVSRHESLFPTRKEVSDCGQSSRVWINVASSVITGRLSFQGGDTI